MTVRGSNYPRRKNDHYGTPAYVTRDLMAMIGPELARTLCDPAPGRRQMMHQFERAGKHAVGRKGDFITDEFKWRGCDVVTNPPYGNRRGTLALQFIERALEVTKPWRGKVVMLLPFDFDCGRTRRHVFEHYTFAEKIVLPYRIAWFNGISGSLEHAWFVWNWRHRGRAKIRYMAASTATSRCPAGR